MEILGDMNVPDVNPTWPSSSVHVRREGLFGFGHFTSLIEVTEVDERGYVSGGTTTYLAQMAPYSMEDFANPQVWIAHKLSQHLRHGCAIEDWEAARIPSLRALQLAWKAAAAAGNDGLEDDWRWMACPEGWSESYKTRSNSSGRVWQELRALSHTTGSGRMTVSIGVDGEVRVQLFAGPEGYGGEGRLALDMSIRIGSDGSIWDLHYTSDEGLIVGREDRLSHLVTIDGLLGGRVGHYMEVNRFLKDSVIQTLEEESRKQAEHSLLRDQAIAHSEEWAKKALAGEVASLAEKSDQLFDDRGSMEAYPDHWGYIIFHNTRQMVALGTTSSPIGYGRDGMAYSVMHDHLDPAALAAAYQAVCAWPHQGVVEEV